MAVDVCSVYLADYPEHRHVLMATDGLNPAAVGRVSLAMGEGVVSVVAESAEPLNLDNAPDHPRYRFKAETGEEYYHGFLGVPIIHHRKVLGVLIVRQRDRRKFAEDEVAFLVTMAAQLAGAGDLPAGRMEGRTLIVDGYRGRVNSNPSEAGRSEYARLANEEAQLLAGLQGLRDLPAETPDGVRLPLYAYSGLIADVSQSLANGAEGIGLYRTEFPFMIRDRFPGEEEQRRIYRQVLEAFAPRPVVLRTLDVGGDKPLSYFPFTEDNPFLGWRGIRISIFNLDYFVVLLSALLGSSACLDYLRLVLSF